MSDLIKREDAIDEIRKSIIPHDIACTYYANLFINAVRRVPSADRPQGEWIHAHMGTIAEGDYCSNCGKVGYGSKFCPNCGSKMRGEHDD